MNCLGLQPILLLAAVVPLSAEQAARVETARDDRDHREEAFTALLENVNAWTDGPGDAAIWMTPDLDALVASPDAYRGDLCLVLGVVEQQWTLERPFDEVVEWFVVGEDDRPVAIYLPAVDAALFAKGQRVSIPARFYKRLEYTDREGIERNCAAFVGAGPTLLGAAPDTAQRLVLMGVGLAAMLGLFLIALLSARAARRPRRPLTSPRTSDGEDGGEPLPDDPVEALEELGRRASPERDVQ